MKTQHTPEPWVFNKDILDTLESGKIKSGEKVIINHCAYELWNIPLHEVNDNMHRIVDCVNACERMDDPAKDIADLRLNDVRFHQARQCLVSMEASHHSFINWTRIFRPKKWRHIRDYIAELKSL